MLSPRLIWYLVEYVRRQQFSVELFFLVLLAFVLIVFLFVVVGRRAVKAHSTAGFDRSLFRRGALLHIRGEFSARLSSTL